MSTVQVEKRLKENLEKLREKLAELAPQVETDEQAFEAGEISRQISETIQKGAFLCIKLS